MPLMHADEKKKKRQTLLRGLAEHDRLTDACKAAHVPIGTHYSWLADDAEYAAAVKRCRLRYRDRVVRVGQERALDGFVKRRRVTTNKAGDTIEDVEYGYDSGVLQMELKRVEPEFKEQKSDVNINAGGGAIIIEGPANPEDFAAQLAEHAQRCRDQTSASEPAVGSAAGKPTAVS